MLILKELQLVNFISHGKTKISFLSNEKLLIDGKSGSGKSSIVESIIWVLYGKGRSDSNSSLVKSGEKTARVVLTMADDDKLYRIERGITASGGNTLKVFSGKDGKPLKLIKETGLKAVQNYLEKKILRSSYLLFINSIAYPQDNTNNFVKQNAVKRKEILLDMVNTDIYDEYLSDIKKKISEIENSSPFLEQSIESGKENAKNLILNIKDEDKAKKDVQELEVKVKNIKNNIKKEEKELTILEVSEENRSKIDSQLQDKKNELYETEELLKVKNKEVVDISVLLSKESNEESNNVKIKELKDTLNKIITASEESSKWNNKYSALLQRQPTGENFDDKKKELNRRMIELIGRKIEICPEINKECPIIVKENNIRIDDFTKSLEKVSIDQDSYLKTLDYYTKEMVELEKTKPKEVSGVPSIISAEINALEKENNELEWNKKEGISNKKKLEEVISLNMIEVISIKKIIVELEEKVSASNSLKISIKKELIVNLERDLSSDESFLFSLNVTLSEIEKNKEELADITKEIKKHEKELKSKKLDTENLKLLKDAFSNTGIKAIIIDYVIPKLEDRINSILSMLSDFTVSLDTQRAGSGEGVVKEGLFINIYDRSGNCYDFANYSGGEKLKIILAISESLSELQNIGFRLIDELFIGLDDDSTEKFADVMEKLHERFNQTLCISHLRNIKDLFESVIMVKKEDETSIVKST